MAQRLPKHLGPAASLPAGFWCKDIEHSFAPPRISCPGCGRHEVFGNAVTIVSNGSVVDEWHCKAEGCGRKEFLILEAWGP